MPAMVYTNNQLVAYVGNSQHVIDMPRKHGFGHGFVRCVSVNHGAMQTQKEILRGQRAMLKNMPDAIDQQLKNL